MGQATNQIEDIEDTRADLGSNLHELEQKVKSVTDWKKHFQTNPMTMLGAAFGGAFCWRRCLADARPGAERGVFSSFPAGSEPHAVTDRQKHKALETWDNIKGALIGCRRHAFQGFRR